MASGAAYMLVGSLRVPAAGHLQLGSGLIAQVVALDSLDLRDRVQACGCTAPTRTGRVPSLGSSIYRRRVQTHARCASGKTQQCILMGCAHRLVASSATVMVRGCFPVQWVRHSAQSGAKQLRIWLAVGCDRCVPSGLSGWRISGMASRCARAL